MSSIANSLFEMNLLDKFKNAFGMSLPIRKSAVQGLTPTRGTSSNSSFLLNSFGVKGSLAIPGIITWS